MFECNDNNLLLILGIGIIVLILLKLIYYNNDKPKKHYRNLNCKNNSDNNYEEFETSNYYKKDYNTLDQSQAQPQAQPQPQAQAQAQPQAQSQPIIENFKQKSIQASVEFPASVPTSGGQPAASEQKQISITVPLINNDIFNPNKIDFDYGEASNTNYTLNVKDNPIEVKPKEDKLSSSDLLPGKSEQKWFENPDVGIKIEDANLLSDAVQKVGVDTVGQTRKNPSYDIRGTVPCPKFQISPWNNSTTEPDYNLKSLY